MEAIRASEMSVNFYWITRRHISEENILEEAGSLIA
jgi:hypothetical protein